MRNAKHWLQWCLCLHWAKWLFLRSCPQPLIFSKRNSDSGQWLRKGCFLSKILEYMSPSIGPSIRWSRPVPSAFFVFQTWQVELISKNSKLFEMFVGKLKTCTCAFLNRGLLQDFSPLWYGVLPVVFLVTVFPTALRTLTSSSDVVWD